MKIVLMKISKHLIMNKSIFMKTVLKTFLFSGVILSFAACSSGDSNSTSNTNTTAEPAAAVSDNGEGIGVYAGKEIAAFDASLVEKGKTTFESKCSACHKTTADKVVGPGLKGVTERRKPQWILNMMTNPVEMTQKDPTAQGLLAEHLTQMTNQNVADEEAMAILNFLRSNDGAK